MTKNLLIVESPAKAKTIEKILGKEFTVKSSYGHIRDLKKSAEAVDIQKNFQPVYEISPEKTKVVKELKREVKQADSVWLATDEDREGEAISWHLCQALDLDVGNTRRIVFREITSPAIRKAIDNPRFIDINLVNAQQARRILDRLVGFELSELLWRKIKGKLSAGRVQSVAVKLIVDREREIQKFASKPYFKVQAAFPVKNASDKMVDLSAELEENIQQEDKALQFLENCKGAEFTIQKIEKKPGKRSPAPPFTTSTLQQEASRKMGFSVKRTMSIAQKLYEAGFITYMRTDSTSLSQLALNKIAETIKSKFGDAYSRVRKYKTTKKLAQEAHEAIRPTYMENERIEGERDLQKLYELIWKRTIASQMSDALLEKTLVSIGISTVPSETLIATGEVLKFDGFLKVYMEASDDEDEQKETGMLPPLNVGMELTLGNLKAIQRFTKPPPRYTEAGLVKKLEELGIGRPSTYAPIISKIMEDSRGYVTKESREGKERNYIEIKLENDEITTSEYTEITGSTKNRLYPTDIGMVVTDFLSENFEGIMNYGFTAGMEEHFDDIAEGKLEWTKMLNDFYFPFHDLVEQTTQVQRKFRGERILGSHPETGKTVLAKLSRYGRPMIQIGTKEELSAEEKPKFANLKQDQNLETISLEEALDLFRFPRTLGKYEGKEVQINSGRYGPYIKHGEAFISLGRSEDPFETDLPRAIDLIEIKKKENAPVGDYRGHPMTKGKGRYGPYIKWNGIYINIPRKLVPEDLTTEQSIALIEEKLEKDQKRIIKKWNSEKITIENGRWGPFIRSGKKNFKLLKKPDGSKYSLEDIQSLSLGEVKEMIQKQLKGVS